MGPTGRPFDFFWRERLRVISEKKISCRLILRENNLARKYLGKNFPALKRISLVEYNAWKKFYTTICRGKNSISRGVRKEFFPKPNHPCPPQKSHDLPLKWVQVLAVPFIFGIACKTGLFCSEGQNTSYHPAVQNL